MDKQLARLTLFVGLLCSACGLVYAQGILQGVMNVQPASGGGGLTLSQACSVNNSATSLACGSAFTGLTAANYILQIAFADNNSTITPGGSGAGCPASWTTIGSAWSLNSAAQTMLIAGGTAQSGSCTPSFTQSGTATTVTLFAFVESGGTKTVDGVGNCAFTYTGAGTNTGASYSTTHSGDLGLTGVVEIYSPGDPSFTINSPWITTSPALVSTSLSPIGDAQGAVYYNQSSSGTMSVAYTQGVSTHVFSCVIGVY